MAPHPLTGKPVLVTGATGFLGTHLAIELVRLGAEVHALRRDPSRSTRLPCPGITWHAGNLTDPESLRQAVRRSGPEVVFHLAAYGVVYGQPNEDAMFRVNVQGTWDLWQALEGHRCRLVHVGSCGEYGEARGAVREDHACRPQWFYPATKNVATVLLSTLGRRGDREVVILRPFGPYGPADNSGRVIPHTISALLRGEEVQVTAGKQLRDYAHVDDHVAALVCAGSCPLAGSGRIYNVGSGEVVTLRHLLETIARAVGGTAPQRVRFGAIPYRPDETWEMYCDISAARAELGWAPRVSLEEGIARTVAWYRRQVQ
jgi:nucleoside-diphosphate-sugar epimerase